MTEIFNKAYNQANQILDGSGLSSVIHKQEGGSFNTYDRALEAWKKDATRGNVMPPIIHRGVAGRIATDTWNRIPNYIKQYGKGIVNKLLYETTGKKLSDTTREDLTKEEVDPMEVAIAKAIVTGTGEFKGLGPTHEDAEALVGGATVSWNPKTGKYGFSDPYDFKDYNKTLPELLQGKAFPDKSYLRALFTGLGHYLVGESKDGVPYPGAMKTTIEISPQRLQDISEKHNFFGVEDRNLSGLEGYSEETSPSGVTTSFVDDAAIDTIAAFKHGGKITSGGLAGIKKSININGQPHKLAWINSDEASALKAMGGSGKKVEGIPAYFYIGPDEEYEDVVVGPTGESPTEEDYMGGTLDVADNTSMAETDAPPAKRTGLVKLPHQEVAKRWAEMVQEGIEERDKDIRTGEQNYMRDIFSDEPIRNLGLIYENLTRAKQKDVVRELAKDLNPDVYSNWDLENFAEEYPAFAPGGLPIKILGWLLSLDKNPVVSTVNIQGVKYNIHKDGTFKERKESEDNVYQGNYEEYPQKLKKLPKVIEDLTEPEEEEELTGMAALLAKRPEATSREDSNVHLEALLNQIYGEPLGQSMLG